MIKKIVGAMLPTLIFSYAASAQEIVFENPDVDLGVLSRHAVKDSVVFHDYTFTNTGDKPLQIKRMLTSCGCTSVYSNQETVEPGEKGTIRLSYHLKHLQNKDVFMTADVYSNAKNMGIQKGVHNLKFAFSIQEGVPAFVGPYHVKPATATPTAFVYSPTDDYEKVLDRVAQNLRSRYTSSSDDEKVAHLVTQMKSGGCFHHIDYDCTFRTNWQPVEHMESLLKMALAYTHPESSYYLSSDLYGVIEEGMRFWIRKKPVSNNWWYNQIGGSQAIADLMAVLYTSQKGLDSDILQDLSEIISKSDPRKWTGANKLDIARHHLYRGCLHKDADLVQMASQEAFYPVQITPKEGVQEDMSYHQHGAQLYIGGYGIVFVQGIGDLAYLLRGTPYALSSEKLDIFSNFLRNGFFKVYRGPYIDWSTAGRSISRQGIVRNLDLLPVIEKMGVIDPEHRKTYEQIYQRFSGEKPVDYHVATENINFYCSNYMMHQNDDYIASVRTASTRMMKAENGNGENLKSTYLSDGAFYVRQSGDEYYEIFPYWDWTRIPGTTTSTILHNIGNTWGVKGTSRYTGGISDKEYGAFAYYHQDHGYEAQKGWFFLDDFIVALGQGITAQKEPLQTTLEQCFLRSPLTVADQNSNEHVHETMDQELQNPHYVIHNNMLYAPLSEGTLQVKAQPTKGNWSWINYNQSNKELTADLFSLVWKHPQAKENAQYAYIQIPGCDDPKELAKIKESLVYHNEDQIQVVQYKDISLLLFYAPGKYEKDGFALHADRPSLFMVRPERRGKDQLHVVNLAADSRPVSFVITRDGVQQSLTVATEAAKETLYEVEWE